MPKPTLTFEITKLHDFTESWLKILMLSKMFNLDPRMMPENQAYLEACKEVYPGGRRHKHGEINFIRITTDAQSRLIVLDSEFNENRSAKFAEVGLYKHTKPDLIIKTEKNPKLEALVDCPVKFWVMFPGGPDFKLVDKFKYGSKRFLHKAVMATGKHSLKVMKRQAWFEKAKEIDGIEAHVAIPPEQYLNLLRRSKWGVILSRSTNRSKRKPHGDHNSREPEFVSNGIPMAMNYVPEFGVIPFKPNEQFFYMEKPDDLEKLLTEDPEPYHKQSVWLWENYFRPDKAAELLMALAEIR